MLELGDSDSDGEVELTWAENDTQTAVAFPTENPAEVDAAVCSAGKPCGIKSGCTLM